MRKSLEDRFWEKVDVRGDDDCWPWKAGMFRATGYGQFHFEGKPITAHRMSLILDGRDPGPEGDSRHMCDRRDCVNPRHLVPGSRAQNVNDARQKGRLRGGTSGESNGMSRLTVDDVREIRRLLADGETGASLARRFGVSDTTVSLIKKRKTWRNVK